MDEKRLKWLSVQEFTQAAGKYEGNRAGIYTMCRRDYPEILAELEKEPFSDLLDAGCGPAPMLALLAEKYPERRYTGIDLTPAMIETARAKALSNVELVVGDCERLPFPDENFDAVICSMSFHHYPHPQAFFDGVFRVLRPGGRLVLRDMTVPGWMMWFVNGVELPLARILGHGDVKCYSTAEVCVLCERAGLTVERCERRSGFRLHCVARKKQK